jgi:galactose mutarotase-like enzyme
MLRLENADLIVEVAAKGAELVSVYSKQTKLNYLWNADPQFWSRHAPVLFPIVGKLKNDNYRLKGQVYHLSQHGFARDAEFKCLEATSFTGRYLLRYNEKMLSVFPFQFEFEITYRLDQSAIRVEYHVVNIGEEMMYFSLGAHPGFICPLRHTDLFSDYYIQFEFGEALERHLLTDGLFTGKTEPVSLHQNRLKLNELLFEKDALVFKNLSSQKVYLKSDKHAHGVAVDFAGFPYLGIWKKSQASFICIEPWYGLADAIGFEGEFNQKEGVCSLDPGNDFLAHFTMYFF